MQRNNQVWAGVTTGRRRKEASSNPTLGVGRHNALLTIWQSHRRVQNSSGSTDSIRTSQDLVYHRACHSSLAARLKPREQSWSRNSTHPAGRTCRDRRFFVPRPFTGTDRAWRIRHASQAHSYRGEEHNKQDHRPCQRCVDTAVAIHIYQVRKRLTASNLKNPLLLSCAAQNVQKIRCVVSFFFPWCHAA